jgi:hypothetical protein
MSQEIEQHIHELVSSTKHLLDQLYAAGIHADPAPDIMPVISALRKITNDPNYLPNLDNLKIQGN